MESQFILYVCTQSKCHKAIIRKPQCQGNPREYIVLHIEQLEKIDAFTLLLYKNGLFESNCGNSIKLKST